MRRRLNLSLPPFAAQQTPRNGRNGDDSDVYTTCHRHVFAKRCLSYLDISDKDACAVLNNLINHNNRHRSLRQALFAAGYKVRGKGFTARQIRILTEYIATHENCINNEYHNYLLKMSKLHKKV